MSEVTNTVSRTIPFSLADVWQVMQRTADLRITDGWETTERMSDSSWTGALEKATVTCETAFDEAAHTAEVSMHNSLKRHTVDTTLIEAAAVSDGTQVTVTTIIRGGAVTMFMARLTGEAALGKVNENIISNIESLCSGGESHDLSQEDLESYAHARLEELGKQPDE